MEVRQAGRINLHLERRVRFGREADFDEEATFGEVDDRTRVGSSRVLNDARKAAPETLALSLVHGRTSSPLLSSAGRAAELMLGDFFKENG